MTEITLKDGMIFNSKYENVENAIADIKDYVYAEYDEMIKDSDIDKIVIYTWNPIRRCYGKKWVK